MTSPKSKRIPPNRNFNDYVLTLSRGPHVGITDVPQNKFTQAIGFQALDYDQTNVYALQDIGFNFSFDNKNYT